MHKKITRYYKSLSIIDFIRKFIFYFLKLSSGYFFTKLKIFLFFKNTRIKIGRGLRIHGFPVNINVGNGTHFYDNCIFEFGVNCSVNIGTHVVFSYGVVFCCNHEIVIGNDVQIGEYSSIRDTTHDHTLGEKSMKYNKDLTTSIKIGSDVWIGRGCVILPGTIIEDGVVVGANSLVKGILKRHGIYGGIPAKLIKFRVRV